MREMKGSGVAWIGEMPTDWCLYKMKHLGEYINGFPFKPEDWSNSGKPIIRIQDLTGSNKEPNYFAGTLDDKYLIHYGDILVSWAATLDAFVWDKEDGWLNQHIFKAIPDLSVVDKEYYLWLLKTAMRYMNDDNKHGIVMQHVTLPVFNNFLIPMPPLAEQGRIAEVLDAACSKVDALIANQSAQIEKLRAYKQSLITETVTKGLDPEAPMKNSGNDYIGDIPAHWSAIKAKYICNMQAGKNLISEQIAETGAYPVYGGNGIRGYFSEYNYDGACLLVGRQGALCGNVHYVSGKFWATEHAVITEPKSDIELRYLFYLLTGANLNLYVSPTAAQPGLSVSTVQNILLCLAPKDEQSAIADYLDAQCAKIDALIALKQQKIDRLGQYKKSLIYEYVTGKKEA